MTKYLVLTNYGDKGTISLAPQPEMDSKRRPLEFDTVAAAVDRAVIVGNAGAKARAGDSSIVAAKSIHIVEANNTGWGEPLSPRDREEAQARLGQHPIMAKAAPIKFVPA